MALHLTRQLKRAFEGDPRNCILFVGAGLSTSGVRKNDKGLPTWKQLIQAMIEDLKDSEKCDELALKKIEDLFDRNDFLKIAQIFRDKTRPDQYTAFLKEQLDPSDLVSSKVHELILSIDFKGIVTTNFDCVFETQSNRLQPLIYPQGFDDVNAFRRHGFFAKIHGCIRNTANPADNLILSEESYLLLRSNPKYQTLLQSIFLLNPLLTVGFSLTDPDFLRLIDDLKEIFKESMPTIYSLMLTDDEALRTEWRNKGVEIIPYKDHKELISFFSELKQLTNSNWIIQELKPKGKESEIDYYKYINLWRHTQSKEEIIKLTQTQIDKLKTTKEKEVFLFQLLAIINPDEAYLLTPQLIELKTLISERVLHSLFSKFEIEDKWNWIEPSKSFVSVHSWLLKHWHETAKYDYKYAKVNFINCFKWLLNTKWTEFGINSWDIFNNIFKKIISKKIQWKLDDLYNASEDIKGAAERIEKIVFNCDFVKEDDSANRWYKDWFTRAQDNIQFTKFRRKILESGWSNYKSHLNEAFKFKDFRYSEFVLEGVIVTYTHHTHLTLHSSSGAYDPIEARKILEALVETKSKENQLRVLWAINRFPEEHRGLGSLGEDNKNLREELFYKLWWCFSNETRIEYLAGNHKHRMHNLLWNTGQDLLLNKFLGLSYDIDKDFVTEFNSSLDKHKSKEKYERYEPRPLQELWRYRELKYMLSKDMPPELIRRIAIYRVDWDNSREGEVRWKEAKIKAQRQFTKSTIKKYFSKSDKNYVLDNLLGSYSPNTFTVTLFPQVISQIADDLDVNVDALGTIAYIHLTIHSFCHVAKDLNGRDWFDFSLPEPEQPIFKLSKLHETITQFYTFKLIDYLQDEKLRKAFIEFEKYSEDTYSDWRKVENYSLEDMRTVLIKYRKMTTNFPDLTT